MPAHLANIAMCHALNAGITIDQLRDMLDGLLNSIPEPANRLMA